MSLKPPKEESPPPQRILIVSPSAQAVDLLLSKLETLKEQVVRIGISHERQDLNEKYALF